LEGSTSLFVPEEKFVMVGKSGKTTRAFKGSAHSSSQSPLRSFAWRLGNALRYTSGDELINNAGELLSKVMAFPENKDLPPTFW
jgi:hypothetical protein